MKKDIKQEAQVELIFEFFFSKSETQCVGQCYAVTF